MTTHPVIVGFSRVVGFDHAIRCVTDAAPNSHGQKYVVRRDGFRVSGGYMFAPDVSELLPLAAATGEEVWELRACMDFLESGLADLSNKLPCAVDC